MLFRADASASIGTGHVVRSLALADELGGRGWRASVAARALPDALVSAIESRGIELINIPDSVDANDEWSTVASSSTDMPDAVVVDHYELGQVWEREGQTRGAILVAIDDLADRPHDVDILLNQNVGVEAGQYASLVPSRCQLLIGPRYALLRPEFAIARRRAQVRRLGVRSILVFFSGADDHNVTGATIEELRSLEGIEIDVVCGPAYDHVDHLRALIGNRPWIRVHVNTTDMARLMTDADLAVGAPSSASWERCCVGLPAVLVVLAQNQVVVNDELNRLGAAFSLGWYDELRAGVVASAVKHIRTNPDLLEDMSRAAFGLVDGGGTRRVADAIEVAANRRHEGG